MRPTHLLLLALAPACATVVEPGHLDLRGTTPGSDASIVPDACRFSSVPAGVLTGKRRMSFTSNDGPAAVTIQDDGSGPTLKVARVVNGKPTVLEFPRARCSSLAVRLQPADSDTDRSLVVGIDAQIDCTLHGVNIAGSVHFSRCGSSAVAEAVLDSFRPAASPAPAPANTAEVARLAALPRAPAQVDLPSLPAALRGLSFRALGRIAGTLVGNETNAQAEQACRAGITQLLTGAGWTAVTDPKAHSDLVVEALCTGHATSSLQGNLIELKYPVSSDTPGVIVQHEGEVIATVPAGPLADFVCETNGAAEPQAFSSCAARAEQWAQGLILKAIVSSEPLARLAQQLKAKVINPYPKSAALPAATADPGTRMDDEAVALLDLGVALYEKGDLKGARKQMAAAQKLVPDKANPWRWLGLVDARLGNCAAAVPELESFLKLAPADDPRAVEVKVLRDGCQRLQRR